MCVNKQAQPNALPLKICLCGCVRLHKKGFERRKLQEFSTRRLAYQSLEFLRSVNLTKWTAWNMCAG